MNDTVTRLMELADKAIAAQDQRLGCLAQDYRETLQDELQKLFTPLSDEVILEKWMSGRAACVELCT